MMIELDHKPQQRNETKRPPATRQARSCYGIGSYSKTHWNKKIQYETLAWPFAYSVQSLLVTTSGPKVRIPKIRVHANLEMSRSTKIGSAHTVQQERFRSLQPDIQTSRNNIFIKNIFILQTSACEQTCNMISSATSTFPTAETPSLAVSCTLRRRCLGALFWEQGLSILHVITSHLSSTNAFHREPGQLALLIRDPNCTWDFSLTTCHGNSFFYT